MGFSISWVGLKDTSLDEACALMQYRRRGETAEVPDFPICGMVTQERWSIIWFNVLRAELSLVSNISNWSARREMLIVHVEEHAMMQTSEFWVDGKLKWLIDHHSQQGLRHLDIESTPPPYFDDVRVKYLALQDTADGVDYVSEIPLVIAQRLSGFRHDESGDVFERLEAVASPRKRGFSQSMFG